MRVIFRLLINAGGAAAAGRAGHARKLWGLAGPNLVRRPLRSGGGDSGGQELLSSLSTFKIVFTAVAAREGAPGRFKCDSHNSHGSAGVSFPPARGQATPALSRSLSPSTPRSPLFLPSFRGHFLPLPIRGLQMIHRYGLRVCEHT